MQSLKFFILFLISFLSFSSQASFLESHELKERVKKEIAELDINFKIKQNLELTEGLNALLQYKYSVEPSFKENFYTRIDEYKLKTEIRPGDIIEGKLPVYLNIDKGASVVFARFIKGQKEAGLKKPLFIHQIPLNARQFDKLPKGTLTSIPTNLSLTVGSQYFNSISAVSASAGIYYSFNGKFNIHILKLDDGKARVRIFSERSKSRGINGEINLDLDIFEISLLNKAVKKIVGDDLFKLGFNKSKGQLVLFDYIFNMKDSQARESYDKILSSTVRFKRLKYLNPLVSGKSLYEIVTSDLSHVERLAKVDSRKVKKVISGVDSFEIKSKNIGISLKLIDLGLQKDKQRHHFRYTEGFGEEKNILIHSRSREAEHSFIWGLKKESKKERYFVAARADKNGWPLINGLTNFGMTFDLKDKSMGVSEQKKTMNRILRNLSKKYADQIDWKQLITDKRQRNTRVYLRVTLDSKIRSIISSMEFHDLKEALYSYRDWLIHTKGVHLGFDGQNRAINKLQEMIRNLTTLDGEYKERDQRMKDFIQATREDTFEEIGMGALIAIAEKSGKKLERLVNVELSWSSDTVNYHKSFGENQLNRVLRSIEFINDVIQNGNSFDFQFIEYKN